MNVTFEYVPSTYDPRDKESFQGIKWKYTVATDIGSFSGEYTQGIGHLPKAWGLVPQNGRFSISQLQALNDTLRSGYRYRIETTVRKPTNQRIPEPAADDLLYCLFSDADALNYTFDEWADNYGYDTDSRKAEAIYNACRQVGLDLLRVLGPAGFEQEKQRIQELGL